MYVAMYVCMYAPYNIKNNYAVLKLPSECKPVVASYCVITSIGILHIHRTPVFLVHKANNHIWIVNLPQIEIHIILCSYINLQFCIKAVATMSTAKLAVTFTHPSSLATYVCYTTCHFF